MSEPFIGEIRIFGFNFAPRNWAFCDGQMIEISQNQTLFALLGDTYGGDGRTEFGLPDLRGRMPMGFGNGPRLTPRRQGEKRGQESTTNVPAHSHNLKATVNEANEAAPSNGSYLAKGNAIINFSPTDTKNYFKGTPTNTVTLGGLSPTGNTGGVSLMNPFLALNFSIALQGIFPSRN